MTTENADRSPDDTMDPDKEARMLLNPPNESVQFSQNASSTNGQVVLPVSNGRATSGVGMTKQELMKYANDPFWVRLRMTLFVLFWVVWLAMLVGSVLIIMFAPGCPATASLPWWKKCSLVQISLKTEGATIKEQLSHATSEVKALKDNLDVLKAAQLDGFLVTGLDPFLLANLDNKTETETNEFRGVIAELNQAAHEDGVKGKIIFGLELSKVSEDHLWFKESLKNGSAYNPFFIWRAVQPKNGTLGWGYNTDRYMYYGRRSEGNAVLNYADADMKDKMHALVLSWVRTKLDGIQADGDFWVDDSENHIHASSDVQLQVHKWIKSGGQNKALLIADSELAAGLVKQGEADASFELAPESSLWNEVSKAENVQEALKKAFSHYVELEKESAEQVKSNTTTKDGTPAPVDVGAGWRAFKVPFPASESNVIAKKHGLSIAEGVLTSFFMLPKATPIVQTDGSVSEQLSKVKSSNLLATLDKLRRDQSETFMLGATQLPEVSQSNVFAVSRQFTDKNGAKNAYLLLINFASTSAEVAVKGSFPDPALFAAKVVLTDSQNTGANGTPINLSSIKLEPKQVLLVEFAPKE